MLFSFYYTVGLYIVISFLYPLLLLKSWEFFKKGCFLGFFDLPAVDPLEEGLKTLKKGQKTQKRVKTLKMGSQK